MSNKATTKDAYKLLHEGAIAMSSLEANGIRVDMDMVEANIEYTKKESLELASKLKGMKVWKKWKRAFGDKAKLTANEQLGHVLFNVMGYPCREYTEKDHRPKTDAKALSALASKEPFVDDYIRFSQLNKINSSFLSNLRKESVWDGKYWIVHPFFNIGGKGDEDRGSVKTYRGSSDTPNFQNLPSRIAWITKIVRECIIARDGHRIVENDFKAIEVAVAYCYHLDPTMKKYLLNPKSDMHRDSACDCYLLNPDQVSPESRYNAKNKFVFPAFYGSYYIDCAKALWEAISINNLRVRMPHDGPKESTGIGLREHLASKGITKLGRCDPEIPPVKGTFEFHIKEVEDYFWNVRFPVYTSWKKSWYNAYLEKGYFHTKTGFTIRGDMKRNDVLNYGIQGDAFHCLLWSIIEKLKWIKKNKMATLIVANIHDSDIADSPKDEYKDYIGYSKELMSRTLRNQWEWIKTPMSIESSVSPVGGSWWQKKEYHEL